MLQLSSQETGRLQTITAHSALTRLTLSPHSQMHSDSEAAQDPLHTPEREVRTRHESHARQRWGKQRRDGATRGRVRRRRRAHAECYWLFGAVWATIIIDIHYNQYDALIGDGRACVEAPSCERGVHVRTCRCTPHLTCVRLLSNGSLAAHQVQTQSAQQFARYGKRVCTCARADATHPDLCKARIYWAPSHIQNLNAILPAVCEIWKRGVHVRTCRCTPPQTCKKTLI